MTDARYLATLENTIAASSKDTTDARDYLTGLRQQDAESVNLPVMRSALAGFIASLQVISESLREKLTKPQRAEIVKIIYCAVCCILLAVMFHCSSSPGATQDERRYLDAITEHQPGLVNIAGLELADADAISLVDGANPYIGLRVYPDQPLVNNGKRAEISFNFPYSPGETIVYEWKIMLPLLFPPSDVPDIRWWSVSQWHDQPNINKGETWDNFPAHPPAIALEYENLNGQDYLGFYHGIFNTERVGLIPLLRGQWLHLRAEIHWSQGEDGSAQLFLGDSKTPILSARGANMFNDYQHYFKIGQYRDPAINTDNTVYFDDVRIYKKPGILLMALPAILGKPSARGNWWRPAPGTSWQWQLSGTVDTSIAAAMYDVDLHTTPQATIDQLHRQGQVVICYLSAGSWEAFRDDAAAYPQSVLGKTLDGWPDERWVDIRRMDLLGPILKARMDMAVRKQCDGIEPDNVDGYANDSGFPLTAADQLAFNRWLAREAHQRKLSIGLKNDLAQVAELVDDFDWALNEQCFQYDECELLLPFIAAGKAVFGVEYAGEFTDFCPRANRMNFDWLKKKIDLDAWQQRCR